MRPILFVFFGCLAGLTLLFTLGIKPFNPAGMIVAAVLFGITAVLGLRIVPPPLPPGVCLGCGYDLRATPDRCPECGRPHSDNDGPQP